MSGFDPKRPLHMSECAGEPVARADIGCVVRQRFARKFQSGIEILHQEVSERQLGPDHRHCRIVRAEAQGHVHRLVRNLRGRGDLCQRRSQICYSSTYFAIDHAIVC